MQNLAKAGKVGTVLLAGFMASANTAAPDTAASAQQDASAAKAAHVLSPAVFAQPPRDTFPQTWFHSMSSNMSKEGITKDLEAMAAIGLKGFTLFHVTQGVPSGDVKFLSPLHIDMLDHLAAESERLGLEYVLHNADGWSSSGGPWVTPEMSMKELVWSEAYTSGGALRLQLAEPFSREGLYKDVAVLAYPTLALEKGDLALDPVITSSASGFDGSKVGTSSEAVRFRTTLGKIEGKRGWNDHGWLVYDFGKPVDINSLTMAFDSGRRVALELETSMDGVNFTPYGELPISRLGKRLRGTDVTITAPPARYYRIISNEALSLYKLEFTQLTKIDSVFGRTNVARVEVPELRDIGAPPPQDIIDPAMVIDLSDKLDASGRLVATLPKGDWTIMRFGMTSTGAVNDPASPEGVGLEIDKLSKEAAVFHYEQFVGKLAQRMPGTMDFMQIDSYEVGGQSWTDGFETIFADTEDYDLLPYLPLYAGRFVGSAETSERVLSDTRRLVSKMIVDNYYTAMRDRAAEDGIRTIIEPYGFGPFNFVDSGGVADVPMGEFWVGRDHGKIADARSAANTYGKPIVATEAFTATGDLNWGFHPGAVKIYGDRMWAIGVNEFTFHRFAHQANTHVAPGMLMHHWGINFDRTQPWWDTGAKAWVEYIARGQYLLRQGVPVNDILYVLGDAAPTGCPEEKAFISELKVALSYDCLNTDRLLAGMTYADGKITLATGAVYDAMVIPETAGFLPATAQALAAIVGQGVPVYGTISDMPLGLSAQSGADAYKLAASLISAAARPLSELPKDRLADVVLDNYPRARTAHRRNGDSDIHFILNPADKAESLLATVKGACRMPELWDPATGVVTRLASYTCSDGQMQLRFDAEADEGLFLVLREAAGQGHGTARMLVHDDVKGVVGPVAGASLAFTGPWEASLTGWNVPDRQITLPALIDLKDHSDTDIRHHSGSIVYTSKITLPADWARTADRTMLDLGQVEVAATVSVNGRDLGTLWAAPYQMDVTDALRPGPNTVRIRVDNSWANRLIGDEALPQTDGYPVSEDWVSPHQMVDWYKENRPPPPGPRSTFTTRAFFTADSPLVPSGLIGPVRLVATQLEKAGQ